MYQYFLPPSAVYSFHGWLARARCGGSRVCQYCQFIAKSEGSVDHVRDAYLGWCHHVLGLGPLRDFGERVVVVDAPFWRLVFLPWARLPIWARGIIHDERNSESSRWSVSRRSGVCKGCRCALVARCLGMGRRCKLSRPKLSGGHRVDFQPAPSGCEVDSKKKWVTTSNGPRLRTTPFVQSHQANVDA